MKGEKTVERLCEVLLFFSKLVIKGWLGQNLQSIFKLRQGSPEYVISLSLSSRVSLRRSYYFILYKGPSSLSQRKRPRGSQRSLPWGLTTSSTANKSPIQALEPGMGK